MRTLILFLMALTVPALAQSVFRDVSFEQAQKLAGNRPLVVEFGAGWSQPTNQMKQVWNDPKLADWIRNQAVAVRVDGDKRKDLIKRFGVKSYPTILVLHGDKELGRKVGLQKAGPLVSWLAGKALDVAAQPTGEELDTLSVWSSASGATITLLGTTGNPRPEMVMVGNTNRMSVKFPVIAGEGNTWFNYTGNGIVMRAYRNGDEIVVQDPQKSTFRWTRRGGDSKFPIPEYKPDRFLGWKHPSGKEKIRMLRSKDAISLELYIKKGDKWYTKATRARWVSYPNTFVIADKRPVPGTFLTSGNLKLGSVTYWPD